MMPHVSRFTFHVSRFTFRAVHPTEVTNMSQAKTNKRREGTIAIKALIAAGAVAATVVGWALVPANDPPAGAAAAGPTTGQTQLSVPGAAQTGPATLQPTVPQNTQPQVTTPRGFARQPFTRSHSSR
jgi:hypothetical protein